MESSAVALTKLTVPDRFSLLTDDDALFCIAATLEDSDLLALMTTSNTLRRRLLVDDVWVNKVSMLASCYPGLAHLESGEAEPAFAWYMRWRRGLASAQRMAHAHANGEMPYMRMYGTFVDSKFVASTPLRLPAPYGLIVELVSYAARLGMADPHMDAALMFKNAPAGADANFWLIVKQSTEAVKRGVAAPSNLKRLVVFLETVYRPTAPGLASPETIAVGSSVGSSAVHGGDLSKALAGEQAHSEVRERVLSAVRRRLTRTQQELQCAYERIAHLEAENLQLRARVADLEAENRGLKRQVAQLTGTKRALERELDERPTEEQLAAVKEKLKEERARAKAAEAKLRPIHLEKARLVKQLRAAEQGYEEAEAEVARLRPDAELESQLMYLHEAELRRNCAAQVAAAHHAALSQIEHALDTELARRSYFTPEQYVERAIRHHTAGCHDRHQGYHFSDEARVRPSLSGDQSDQS